jgi:hypothetical protein
MAMTLRFSHSVHLPLMISSPHLTRIALLLTLSHSAYHALPQCPGLIVGLSGERGRASLTLLDTAACRISAGEQLNLGGHVAPASRCSIWSTAPSATNCRCPLNRRLPRRLLDSDNHRLDAGQLFDIRFPEAYLAHPSAAVGSRIVETVLSLD